MRTPENLDRLADLARETDARRRAIADRGQGAPAGDPGSQQQHQQTGPEHGQGRGPSPRS